MENDGKVIALLIDAENVSPKYIKTIIDEVSMYGTPAYKRIYGDWTAPDMVSWKKMLLEHNLTPIQQFSYTQGKNASDSAMIIDAMDILYTKNVDGFCIVSSDSDFTRLARAPAREPYVRHWHGREQDPHGVQIRLRHLQIPGRADGNEKGDAARGCVRKGFQAAGPAAESREEAGPARSAKKSRRPKRVRSRSRKRNRSPFPPRLRSRITTRSWPPRSSLWTRS